MKDDLHDTILAIARVYTPEPRIFCAIKQPGEKVCAHLSWLRQAELEHMPVDFIQSHIVMGSRK